MYKREVIAIMTDEVLELLNKAKEARFKYNVGAISREEAKKEINPYILKFNQKSDELAKKYNVKAKHITFSSFIR